MAVRRLPPRSLLLLLGTLRRFLEGADAFGVPDLAPSRRRGRPPPPAMAASSSAGEASAEAAEATTTVAALEKIDGISSPALMDRYDTFLLDMWGVMHDGTNPYEGVLEAVQELKKAGKRMIVLSNSSKRREKSERMLRKLGFEPTDFHNIITSGDVSHGLLRNEAHLLGCPNWDAITSLVEQKKTNAFVFGSGDEDEGYCASAGWTLTSIEEADLIVARGTFTVNDGKTVTSKLDDEAAYWRVMEESLTVASARKVPMLVCNPDKVRPDEGLPPMPGAIGDTYERYLWTSHCAPLGTMTEATAREYVKRVGKPFREVYDVAFSGSGGDEGEGKEDRGRAIMVGDALETDVTGGRDAGVDALWVVRDGIHAEDVGARGAEGVLEGFNENGEFTYAYGRKVAPRYWADHFRW